VGNNWVTGGTDLSSSVLLLLCPKWSCH